MHNYDNINILKNIYDNILTYLLEIQLSAIKLVLLIEITGVSN